MTFVSATDSTGDKTLKRRETEKNRKRGLLQLGDGSVLDDDYAISQGLDNDYFSELANFGLHLTKDTNEAEEEENVREPAEGEVRQIMDICDGCAAEPFEKALIIDWRSVPKKLYSGALYLPATQACKAF